MPSFQQSAVSYSFLHQEAKWSDPVPTISPCIPPSQEESPAMKSLDLHSNDLWQLDVTHINSFSHLKCIHVFVDNFSWVIYAAAETHGPTLAV